MSAKAVRRMLKKLTPGLNKKSFSAISFLSKSFFPQIEVFFSKKLLKGAMRPKCAFFTLSLCFYAPTTTTTPAATATTATTATTTFLLTRQQSFVENHFFKYSNPPTRN